MAITRGTLQIARGLRRAIGVEVNDVVRATSQAWVDAWDDLAPPWGDVAAEVAAQAQTRGRWPRANQIANLNQAMTLLDRTEQILTSLADQARSRTINAAGRVVDADLEREARIIASQAPTPQQEALTGRLTVAEQDQDTIRLQVMSRIQTDATDRITQRAAGQITADFQQLPAETTAAMRRELIRGVRVGDNPRRAAQRLVTALEGRFTRGLARASNITRTEMLDAYRGTAQAIHTANRDVVPAWQWLAELDRRVCPSCASLHGTVYPASEPGPDDHQQGRCARLPQLASWAELGITAPEPPSAMRSSQAWFGSQPQAVQLQIMGPERLALYQSGRITWADLSTRRSNRNWRDSYVPTPVQDLRRRAAGRI